MTPRRYVGRRDDLDALVRPGRSTMSWSIRCWRARTIAVAIALERLVERRRVVVLDPVDDLGLGRARVDLARGRGRAAWLRLELVASRSRGSRRRRGRRTLAGGASSSYRSRPIGPGVGGVRQDLVRIHALWPSIAALRAVDGPAEAPGFGCREPGVRRETVGCRQDLLEEAGQVPVAALVGLRGSLPYQGSKAAVLGLTRGAAVAYGAGQHPRQRNLPGPDRHRDDGVGRHEAVTTMKAQIPLRRDGRPEEVSAAVVFLASDESSVHHRRCVACRRRLRDRLNAALRLPR